MGNIAGANTKDLPLFNQCGSKEDALFLLTNKWNLLSFLGSGMVVPARMQFRYKADCRDFFGGALGLWKNGLPSGEEISAEDRTPGCVVIRFDSSSLCSFLENGVIFEDDQVLVYDGPIPLTSISAISFQTQEEVDEFLIKLPVDVLAEGRLFEGRSLSTYERLKVPDKEFTASDNAELSRTIEFCDRVGGALRAVETLAPHSQVRTDYTIALSRILLDWFGFKGPAAQCEAEEIAVAEGEVAIVVELCAILSGFYPEQGIEPVDVLDRIDRKLRENWTHDLEKFEKWVAFSRAVLNSERDVPVLSDDSSVIKRGVLLFLLRPTLERLEQSLSSSIKPGGAVFSVAAFFAGYFTGLTRLRGRFKGSYDDFSNFVGRLLKAFWVDKDKVYRVAVVNNEGEGPWISVFVDGVVLWQSRGEMDPNLRYVQAMTQLVGYETVYNYERRRLEYQKYFDEKHSQIVYIELVNPLIHGEQVVRFIAPCRDISKKSMLNAMKKKDFLELLYRNGESDMYCTLAFSKKLGYIVAQAVQIVRTMDQEELVLLVNEVARVAHEYEQNLFRNGKG